MGPPFARPLLLAGLCLLAAGRMASPREPPSYVALLETYAAGRYRPAVEGLVGRSRRDVRRSARDARERPELARLFPAAVLLHAEAAFAAPTTEAFHLDEARAYLPLLEPTPTGTAFERDWCLLVGDFYTSQLREDRARPYIERAVALDGDAVAPRLARGVNAALGGWLGDDAGKLAEAASAFETLSDSEVGVEASIRRAHVRLLEGDARRAREALERNLPLTDDPVLTTTVRLLLGKADRELGRLDDALEAYRGALRADPRLQSAAIGASDALRALGRTEEARRLLRVALSSDGDGGPLDTWWRFLLGRSTSFDEELSELRERVRE